MIRPARMADVPACVELFEHMIEAHPMGAMMGAARADLAALLVRMMGEGALLVADVPAVVIKDRVHAVQVVGMIAIFATKHHLSGIPIGHEIAFWVEPAHRGGTIGPRLLQAAEAWACKKGLAVLQIMSPEGSRLAHYYQIQGYQAIETVFLKRL